MGSRGQASGQGAKPPLKLKALFYFKGARMLYSGPISTKYTSVSRYRAYKFIIIIHFMTLKSEVAELRYEVAELSSGELRLTFTTASGPAIEMARLPNFVLQRGTMTSDLAADRSCCRPGLLETGAMMSLMYSGHRPASALYMSSAILNCIR